MCDGESHWKCKSCKSYNPPLSDSDSDTEKKDVKDVKDVVSDWKCGSSYKFDYKAQKSDRTYGVPNGCQKIF